MEQKKWIDTEVISQIAEHLRKIEEIIYQAAPNNEYLSLTLMDEKWFINNAYWEEDSPCDVKIDSIVYSLGCKSCIKKDKLGDEA